MTHPSHEPRISDASTFDEICVYCGATDTRGSGTIHLPCTMQDKADRDAMDQKEKERLARLKERYGM